MKGSEFINDHLKSIVDKLSNENKKVFIAGDFNFDLLKSALHNESFDFFDTMMSNIFIPVITLSTKVNKGHNILIDNKITNHLYPDTISGNLEINLSDGHLPSFLLIPKQNQNHRKSELLSGPNSIPTHLLHLIKYEICYPFQRSSISHSPRGSIQAF